MKGYYLHWVVITVVSNINRLMLQNFVSKNIRHFLGSLSGSEKSLNDLFRSEVYF